ncbi:MAG TPA: CusA/CzcA family heavy metal efflux RND transporter [Bryobacteraceae bacterium]|nr:CusA/CzcA family heavy metal efflux RND transporter [Bryobacteraceae bacterium]
MLGRIIDFHLEHRWFVLAGLAGIIAFGLYTMTQIPIEAFPDLTNNQVVVITECPAMAPIEVEQLVTFPIETALMGLPKTQSIRSISKLGLSMVTLIFDDSVAIYFARQVVNERVQDVRSRLPEGLEPTLGPVATAFGEVYQYTLASDRHSPMELKTLHEWQVKNQLRTIAGVNEINTWGGETQQYHIEVDPVRLQGYGLTMRDVYERVRENNANFGGGFIEHASEQYTVRGLGRTQGVFDLERIVILARAGTPVLLRDVASIAVRPMPRQGAVTRDAKGETVSGMVIMLKGENGKKVIERVKGKLASLTLPEGVKLIPFYDQSTVIDGTLHTVTRNLFEGGVLVMLVLLLFLGQVRAALIVAAVIPLSMLVGFIGMRAFGVSANLMSLGAIDFGMIVDGAVVMMENSVRRLQMRAPGDPPTPLGKVRAAAHEVARPILFGVAIIIAVYMPIFFLEDLEGRMFRPMAITVCAALIGALIFALTAVPAATAVFVARKVKPHREPKWFLLLSRLYAAVLRWDMRNRWLILATSIVVLVAAIGSLGWIGTDFMPRLDEGSLLVQTRKLPGISLTESVQVSNRVEEVIRSFAEVDGVVTKLGRPDVATEAMGIYEGDVYVLLKPRHEWKVAGKDELVANMAAALDEVPGVVCNFTQPMAMRMDETISGIKADVALKIFGEDPRTLEQLAERALRTISAVPGAADAQMEVTSGVAELRVEADRPALARYGLNISDVRDVMDAAIGGQHISDMIEGQRRFAIVLRLPERYRKDPASIENLSLSAPAGERVRLGQVARVRMARGPEVISREDGQRRIVVQSNVRGRDLGSFVAEAQHSLASLQLPPGYWLDWGGQFENQERATQRLLIVLPASVLIIFALLFSTFDSVPQALLILLNVPFAMVGGIAALWARGLTLNLSASVGFIALFGVAVLNGIVLVSSINGLRGEGKGVQDAVFEGALMRFRPVLMTALVASLGFLPMALSTSPGAEVQRPLASVVIGGLITSTGLTLFLIPILYPWFSRKDDTAVEERQPAVLG